MSRITDKELGHAEEADGIEEYDNPMPDWWLGLFFVTVVWAGWYVLDWHVLHDKTQAALYQEELAEARLKWPEPEAQVAAATDAETLEEGAEIFASTCASCHNVDLTGGIGPNLVDAEWIHGGSFAEISTTITEGVGAKGMPAWGPILGARKIAAVASFILSRGGQEAPAVAAAAAAHEGGEDPTTEAGEHEPAGEVDGAAVFAKNCVACHAADLTGGIGPNLVDDEWIHGGELAQIRTTIEQGVPAKGMITWKGILPDAEIEAVAAYIHAKAHAD
ncbi:MAG: c-type cytochrome [Alphaproteobacteria bacterium]|nr:c-type cytochrome [Alphaproteobacteria bacterium]